MTTTAALFGDLPARTLQEIAAVLRRFPDIRWVRLYGSRAMGRHRLGSDIDLAFSSPIDHSAALAAALEELPTPYLFDVTHWESLRHGGLRRHIAEVGVLWPGWEDPAPQSSS
jgi:predicted nucleotidyltransferase